MFRNDVIAIIGLGYVGLPLAIAFGKLRKTIAYDIDHQRIRELNEQIDSTKEVSAEDFDLAKQVIFTSDASEIKDAKIYIITVPTPINKNKQPDLRYLISASETVGSVLKKDDIVIYESTVYPGATEEICVPVLEKCSSLVYNLDFYCGYSPERINPGDKERTLETIVKVTSGSTPEVSSYIDQLYSSIIKVGTYKAESIKVAEAAKVIENTQRDVNIALINELSIIFNKLSIDTKSVLDAAGTKWNFLNFKPGLVGGHCIGVDPYYLTHKAASVGYNSEVILSGRRLNDEMGKYLAQQIIKIMIKKSIQVNKGRILLLGVTFKENCPDTRNTKAIDVINELRSYGALVDIHDPMADPVDVASNLQITLTKYPTRNFYDAIVLLVPHAEYLKESTNSLRKYGNAQHIFVDVKSVFAEDESDFRL